MRDRRSGRYVASVTSGFYGPRLMLADDPLGDWRQASGPAFPADVPDAAVKRIWVIRESEEPEVLYAGTDPAALWRSADSGLIAQFDLLNAGYGLFVRPDLQGLGVLASWPCGEERGDHVADVSTVQRAGRIINHASWQIGGPSFDASNVPRFGEYDPAAIQPGGTACVLTRMICSTVAGRSTIASRFPPTPAPALRRTIRYANPGGIRGVPLTTAPR